MLAKGRFFSINYHMTKEVLHLHVAHMDIPGFDVSNPDAIHPVGASHLRDYLNIMFGKEMPEGEEERHLSDALHQALSDYSTTSGLDEIMERDPQSYLISWLNLIEPMVEAESKVGKFLQSRLEGLLAQGDESDTPVEITNDLTYMLGMYDVGSFALAGVLEIPHPRLQDTALRERSASLLLPGKVFQSEQLSNGLELLIRHPFIPHEQRLRVGRVLEDGKILIANSEQYVRALKMILGKE